MPRTLGTIVFTCCVLAAPPAEAQAPFPTAPAPPPYLGVIDGSIGGLWPIATDDEAEPVTGGFRAGIYLGASPVGRRLLAEFSFGGLSVRDLEYFDPSLGSYARRNSYLLLFNPSLGVDLLQTSRVLVTVRGGGAWTADRTTFSLERAEVNEDESPYENVCDLQAFEARCSTSYGFVGTAGAGVRVFVMRDGGLAVGADYTRYSNGWNQVVGTIGWYARRAGGSRP